MSYNFTSYSFWRFSKAVICSSLSDCFIFTNKFLMSSFSFELRNWTVSVNLLVLLRCFKILTMSWKSQFWYPQFMQWPKSPRSPNPISGLKMLSSLSPPRAFRYSYCLEVSLLKSLQVRRNAWPDVGKSEDWKEQASNVTSLEMTTCNMVQV